MARKTKAQIAEEKNAVEAQARAVRAERTARFEADHEAVIQERAGRVLAAMEECILLIRKNYRPFSNEFALQMRPDYQDGIEILIRDRVTGSATLTVRVYRDRDGEFEVTSDINWSACGSQNLKDTRKFCRLLKDMNQIGESLDDLLEANVLPVLKTLWENDIQDDHGNSVYNKVLYGPVSEALRRCAYRAWSELQGIYESCRAKD